MVPSTLKLRALLVSSASTLALAAAAPAAAQSPLFRGRTADPGQAAARAVQGQMLDQQRAQQRAQSSLQVLARSAATISAMNAVQAAARAAALSAPDPGVPNGLLAGGLVPRLTPGFWENALAPVQAAAAGRTEVTVVQTAPRAILTWDKFNVGRETDLRFDQSRGGADARQWSVLNRVEDATREPSQILGSIRAEGQVFVVNRNGIIFGGGSQVNTATLVASALDVGTWDNQPANATAAQRAAAVEARNARFRQGLLTPTSPTAALLSLDELGIDRLAGAPAGGTARNPSPARAGERVSVVVEAGARLTAAPEGTVILAAPRVVNRGTVASPSGQVIMAAGAGLYLERPVGDAFFAEARARDPLDGFRYPAIGLRAEALRRPSDAASDLRVEERYAALDLVPSTVRNEGVITAPRGNVTLAGFEVVNAAGAIISATTAANRPGSIFLNARDYLGGSPEAAVPGFNQFAPSGLFRMGEVSLGAGSLVEIGTEPGADQLVFDSATVPFAQSRMAINGSVVTLGTGAIVRAPAATLRIAGDTRRYLAAETEGNSEQENLQGGRLRTFAMAPDAVVDLSGVNGIVVPVARNFISIDVRNNLLQNAPLQRDGFLIELSRQRRQVVVDARLGSDILDVVPFVGQIGRGVAERQARGGTLTIESENVILTAGSRIDVSGGWLEYQSGFRPAETRLIGSDGRLYTFGRAPADITFVGVAGEFTRTQPRWGYSAFYLNPLLAGRPVFEPGYVEGFDAGSATLQGRPFLDGAIDGFAVAGRRQMADARANDGDGQSSLDLPAGGALSLGPRTQLNGTPLTRIDPLAAVVNPTIVNSIETPLPTDVDTRLLRLVDRSFRPQPNPEEPQFPLPNLDTFVRLPAGEVLPQARFDTLLPIETVLGRGFSTIDIAGQGLLTVPEGVRIELPAQPGRTAAGAASGPRLSFSAWQGAIDGSLIAPGGTIAITVGVGGPIAPTQLDVAAAPLRYVSPAGAPPPGSLDGTLVVGPRAVLSASGRWVNDNVAIDAGAELAGRAFLNGGTIDLATRFSELTTTPPVGIDPAAVPAVGRDILVRGGAVLDVSGGGYVAVGGTVVGGSAGTLRLRTYVGSAAPRIGDETTANTRAGSDFSFFPSGRLARPVIEAGASISGFGIGLPGRGTANGVGGRLDIEAPRIALGRAETPADADAGVTVLDLDSFAARGFADFRLTGKTGAVPYRGDTAGEIVLAAGSRIAPVAQTLVLAAEAPRLPSGTATERLGVPSLLAQTDRSATRLWLIAGNRLDLGDAATTLYADPGAARSGSDAAIRIAARQPLFLAGTLDAPAGAIEVAGTGALLADDPTRVFGNETREAVGSEFRADQPSVVWLGATARLYARGIAQQAFDPRARLTVGNVRAAGSVSVLESRGFLVLEAGAQIDVSGAVGQTTAIDPTRRLVAPGERISLVDLPGDAGTIQLDGARGAFLDGTLRGAPGGPGAIPGLLRLTARPIEGADPLVRDRGLILREQDGPTLPAVAGFGGRIDPNLIVNVFVESSLRVQRLTGEYVDRTVVRPALLDGSGVGRLELNGFLFTQGTVTLSVPGQITMRAPSPTTQPPLPAGALATPARVTIATGYLVLDLGTDGSRTVVPGSSLDLNAGFIDVQRATAIGGYAGNRLSSATDLRLQNDLSANSDLTITAAQVYPITANVTIRAAGAALPDGRQAGVLRFARPPGAAAPELPLSAGGRLTLQSDQIEQGGVLRAPSGTISFVRAGGPGSDPDRLASVRFLPGSLTSVALDGRAVLFGQTRGGPNPSGFELVPNLSLETPGTTSTGLAAPPAKAITVATANIEVQPGALIDASGGGELLAYRFVPGPLGRRDVLARQDVQGSTIQSYQFSDQRDVFAILPGAQPAAAPRSNAVIDSGSSLGRGDVTANATPVGAQINANDLNGGWVGDSIVIPAGVPGLAPGTYTLLPARYAILPGAYRVVIPPAGSAATAQRSLPGPAAAPDGGFFVSANRILGISGAPEARSRVVQVQPEATWRLFSDVMVDRASDFFTARAARTESNVPRLPIDAGRLSLAATRTLTLAENVGRFDRGPGGRGGVAEISAERIAVTPGGAAYVDPTPVAGATPFLTLSDRGLSTLGVESLTLGSARTAPDAGVLGDRLAAVTPARAVRIASGALLQVPEVVLVANGPVTPVNVVSATANDGIRVEAGARIDASGLLSPGSERDLLIGRPAQVVGGQVNAALPGSAAVLRLAAGPQARVVRDALGTGSFAGISVADGAVLTGGALLIDALGPVSIAPTAGFGVAALDLVASSISLGDGAPPNPTGVTLGRLQLAQLAGAQELALRSRAGISVFGPVSISAGRSVTLDSGSLDAFAAAALTISAGERVQLQNLFNTAPAAPAPGLGGGTLDAVAGTTIALGGGTVALRGFTDARFATPGAVLLRGPIAASTDGRTRAEPAGGLTTDGNLSLASALVTAVPGADFTLTAAGALTLGGPAPGPTPALPEAPIGGRFVAEAGSIGLDTRLAIHGGTVELTSNAGVALGAGADLDLSGRSRQFFDLIRYAPGGLLRVIARTGAIIAAPGTRIDVSSAALEVPLPDGGSDAGAITLTAQLGGIALDGVVLRGAAAAGQRGAEITLDSGGGFDLPALNRQLDAGGFAGGRTVHARQGNLTVDPGQVVRAAELVFTADGGSVVVGPGAVLDASGSRGGRIELWARDTVQLAAGARLDARGLAAGQRGGTVTLGTTAGPLLLGGSVIEVGGGQPLYGSLVRWRLPVGAISGSDFGATVVGARALERQAFATTVLPDGAELTQTLVDGAWAGVVGALAPLGRGNTPAQLVDTPEIEIVGLGRIVVPRATPVAPDPVGADLPIDLAGLRYGGEAGVLTLRAAGTLEVLSSISDGFDRRADDPTTQANESAVNNWLPRIDRSWSLRLVAGNETTSANPLATMDISPLGAGVDPGSLLIGVDWNGAPITVRPIAIRSGTGSIDIGAARDVLLRDPDSVIYTSGRPIANPSAVNGVDGVGNAVQGFFLPPVTSFYPGLTAGVPADHPAGYLEGGGDLRITARRDLLARLTTPNGTNAGEIVTAWLWRLGAVADDDGGYLYREARGPRTLGTGTSCTPPSATCSPAVGEHSTQATWFVRVDQFAQNLGVLGGGDADLRAGRDFQGSISIPTTMRTGDGLRSTYVTLDGRTLQTPRGTGPQVREVNGGGDLAMQVGRDLLTGSQIYLGRGRGNIRVGDSVTDADILSAASTAGTAAERVRVGTVLAVSDAQIKLIAGGTAAITVYDPIERPATRLQLASDAWSAGGVAAVGLFSSQSSASAIRVGAVSGDLALLRATISGNGAAVDALETAARGASGTERAQAPRLEELNAATRPNNFASYPTRVLSELPLPVSLEVVALNGDIRLQQAPVAGAATPLVLRPAIDPRSSIVLLSGGRLVEPNIQSVDYGPNEAPTADQPYYAVALRTTRINVPGFGFQNVPFIPDGVRYFSPTSTGFGNANASERGLLARAADAPRTLLYALNGDITAPVIAPFIGTIGLHAGRDITDLTMVLRHNYESDISFAWAERDIGTAPGRTQQLNAEQIATPGIGNTATVAGPGRLRLIAGRDIAPIRTPVGTPADASTLFGVRTTGNAVEVPGGNALNYLTAVQSAFLPRQGAGIDILFGIGRSNAPGGGGFDAAGFLDRYLDPARADQAYTTYRLEPVRTPTGATTYAIQANAPAPTAPETLAAIRSLGQQEQLSLAIDLYFREQNASGIEANLPGPRFNDYARFYAAESALFPYRGSYGGNFNLQGAFLRTDRGGDINVLGAGGDFFLGSTGTAADINPSRIGVLTLNFGNINIYGFGDVQVGQARVITVDGGDIFIGSSTRDINAGQGARTARFIPPLRVTYGNDLFRTPDPAGSITGSGIATLVPYTDPEDERRNRLGPFGATLPDGSTAAPGSALAAIQNERIQQRAAPNINLVAPIGAIDFGDAGVRSAGNLNVAALVVRNAESAQAAGSTTGVPQVQVPNVAAAVAGAAASGSAQQAGSQAAQRQQERPREDQREAPATVTVEVIGFGGTAEEAVRAR